MSPSARMTGPRGHGCVGLGGSHPHKQGGGPPARATHMGHQERFKALLLQPGWLPPWPFGIT